MLTLKRRGYSFVSLIEFAAYLDDGLPPDGMCALTFDDGTVDNVELLLPLLTELGLPATIFVCPGLLGEGHFAMPPSAEVRLMNLEELLKLASSPLIEIGSHTNLHSDLSKASREEAYEDMVSSKQELERFLKTTINTFAYPKCHYSPACPDAARSAGYTVAVTCAGRGEWRRFELARESIGPLDGRVGFALKSRHLFLPLRESLPGRLARAAARPLRHRDGD
jgi:peptidoglycan/xylan/chitin deacetylase (PgdA/CDA1 family)